MVEGPGPNMGRVCMHCGRSWDQTQREHVNNLDTMVGPDPLLQFISLLLSIIIFSFLTLGFELVNFWL